MLYIIWGPTLLPGVPAAKCVCMSSSWMSSGDLSLPSTATAKNLQWEIESCECRNVWHSMCSLVPRPSLFVPSDYIVHRSRKLVPVFHRYQLM